MVSTSSFCFFRAASLTTTTPLVTVGFSAARYTVKPGFGKRGFRSSTVLRVFEAEMVETSSRLKALRELMRENKIDVYGM
jgi:hypothetical protein